MSSMYEVRVIRLLDAPTFLYAQTGVLGTVYFVKSLMQFKLPEWWGNDDVIRINPTDCMIWAVVLHNFENKHGIFVQCPPTELMPDGFVFLTYLEYDGWKIITEENITLLKLDGSSESVFLLNYSNY